MITDRSPGAASCAATAPANTPAAPAAAARRRSGSTLLAVVVVGLLIGAVPLLGWWTGRAALDRARPGDCLTFVAEVAEPYRIANCSDPGAGFVLLGIRATARECVVVPGTTRTVGDGARFYCIGEAGVDVGRAINDIRPGECLVFAGDRPAKSPCGPGSRPVLAVVHDVAKTDQTDAYSALCAEHGAGEVQQTYAWGIASLQSTTLGTWDRLLCLGPANR